MPDTEYHRQAARYVMIASVARIFEPGHKFDYAPIIGGPQGIGKSSFVRRLYSSEWFGELDCKLDDRQKIAEAISGKWGVELPELSGFHKSEHNDAKMFMRRQHDDVRMAYDRRTTECARQAVFWGTTNDTKYLKDPTGNRSYWPINSQIAEGEFIDTPRLAAMRDALWASAYAAYLQMRAAQPAGDIFLSLHGDALEEAQVHQENARTIDLHEAWAEQIEEWADRPIRLSLLLAEYPQAEFKFSRLDGDLDLHIDPDDLWVVRCAFRVGDASLHALGKSEVARDHQQVQNVDRALGLLRDRWATDGAIGGRTSKSVRRFGSVGRWKVRLKATVLEQRRGWKIVDKPDDDTGLDLCETIHADIKHLI